MTEQDRRAGKDRERQRMTEPPRQAMFDNIVTVGSASGNARHRRDVIGFERMLHSEQKADPQNSEHALPDFTLTNKTQRMIRQGVSGLAKTSCATNILERDQTQSWIPRLRASSELARDSQTHRHRFNRMEHTVHHAR